MEFILNSVETTDKPLGKMIESYLTTQTKTF